MSDYDYPTEADLHTLETWPDADPQGALTYMHERWWAPEWGWREENALDHLFEKHPVRRYDISTGGWSGNESLIGALQSNLWVWRQLWVSHRTGGHYIFEFPKYVSPKHPPSGAIPSWRRGVWARA